MSEEPLTRVILHIHGVKITEAVDQIHKAFGTEHAGSHVHLDRLTRMDKIKDKEIREQSRVE